MKEVMMNLETAKELLGMTDEDALVDIASGRELFGSVYVVHLRKLYAQAKQAASPHELTQCCVRIAKSADAAIFLYRLLFPESAWRESDASWSAGARNLTKHLMETHEWSYIQGLKDFRRRTPHILPGIERHPKGKIMNIDEAFGVICMTREDIAAVNATYLYYNVVSVKLEKIKVTAATLKTYQDVSNALNELLRYANAAIMITNDVYGVEGANVVGLIEVQYEEVRERIDRSFMQEEFLAIAKDFEQQK